MSQEEVAFASGGEKPSSPDVSTLNVDGTAVPVFSGEFWTSKQRDAHRLHEISYRACFKPQLPRFFIERFSQLGDVVLDPFMGRGTTPLEAALLGRAAVGNDINPVCRHFAAPRLAPPSRGAVAERLAALDLKRPLDLPQDLLVFYHPETLRAICSLRAHLLGAETDAVDDWIRMVALNRLTGHSPGFFSVYTMPPNQAVSVKSQLRINERRAQVPPFRDVRSLVLAKSDDLLCKLTSGERERLASSRARWLTGPASAMPQIADESVHLVVTSPPFLDVVDYKTDNWLRCWFCGIDADSLGITTPRKISEWETEMQAVLAELRRVLVPGGRIAFEVGEVRKGKIRLEESVVRAALRAGLTVESVFVNRQKFTKTANCWGVSNNEYGTNTNRIVLLRKPVRETRR